MFVRRGEKEDLRRGWRRPKENLRECREIVVHLSHTAGRHMDGPPTRRDGRKRIMRVPLLAIPHTGEAGPDVWVVGNFESVAR